MTDNFDDLRNDDDLRNPRNQPGDQGGADNDPFQFEDMSSFEDPVFNDPGADADLPEEMGPVDSTERSRSFIIGLFVLIALLVIGLILILFAASQIGEFNEQRRQTVAAIEQTNSFVNTAVAATATAKSWTLTPTNTPLPTFTPTFTLTFTVTPSITPSLTPSPTISGTPSPTFTPTFTVTPSITPLPTQEGIPGTVAAYGTLASQLEIGLRAAGGQVQENTRNIDPRSTEVVQLTQNAQFNIYSTYAVGQLTAIPLTVTALSNPQLQPTLPAIPPTPVGTPLAARPPESRQIANVQRAARQGNPAATGTAAAIQTEVVDLFGIQTAAAFQRTLDASNQQTPPPAPLLTQSVQLNSASTAVALQLTANALLLGAPTLTPSPTPVGEIGRAGIYEDLASGRVAPGNLMIFGVAALGFITLIIVARRLRVRE
jgi:hypothetical protein